MTRRETRKIRRLWNENKEIKFLLSDLLRSLDSSLFFKYRISKENLNKINKLRDLIKDEEVKIGE